METIYLCTNCNFKFRHTNSNLKFRCPYCNESRYVTESSASRILEES